MSRNDLSAKLDEWADDAQSHGFRSGTTESTFEPGRPKRDRRKPSAKRRAADLTLTDADRETADTETEFADADMQRLYARGYFDRLIGQVKGGKEATVYLVGLGDELFAAKVYADIDARTFRDDSAYWAGITITDARIAKAMKHRTRAGQAARAAFWVGREYAYLWQLHRAGLPVPRPAVGPEATAISAAGAVVLMEFIGEGDVPAPRLSDVRLTGAEAESAYTQSAAILVRLAELGLVHGDFSTYNLLWHRGKVVMIDVPQMLELRNGRTAHELLARDVSSLVTSFRRLRVNADEAALRRIVFAAVDRHS